MSSSDIKDELEGVQVDLVLTPLRENTVENNKLVSSLPWMRCEDVKESHDDVNQAMEHIGHGVIECGSIIIFSKGNYMLGEYPLGMVKVIL